MSAIQAIDDARLPDNDAEVATRLGGFLNSGGVFAPMPDEGPSGRSLRFKRRETSRGGFVALDMRLDGDAAARAGRWVVNAALGLPQDPDAANDNDPDADMELDDDASLDLRSHISLEELTHPGGLVEDLVDWITASAERPSRPLALSAVLPFVAALIGRRFASPSDLRTNLYVCALAPSGVGKDHARAQIKRLVMAAGLDPFAGPARFMSATAVRKALMQAPSCVAMMDEFGGFIKQITDARGSIHQQLIRNDLLELFSSASTYMDGLEYAGTKAERLYNPNLCVYGTSTPDDFWATLSSSNSSDGLLPRFILFNVSGPKPRSITPGVAVTDLPTGLVKRCRNLAVAGRGAGNMDSPRLDRGDASRVPTLVPLDESAQAKLLALKEKIETDEHLYAPEALPFVNRTAEHAIKLALVVAVATNPSRPIITGANMAWAAGLAWVSTCELVREAMERVADSPREAAVKRILSQIRKAPDGLTEGKIIDRNKGLSARERGDILADLRMSGRIELRSRGTRGRPIARFYPR